MKKEVLAKIYFEVVIPSSDEVRMVSFLLSV